MTMSKLDRERAQARFKTLQKQGQERAKALTEVQASEIAIADKTARLRALRLARDAAAPETPAKTKAAAAAKTPTATKRVAASGRVVARTADTALKYEKMIRERDERERDYAQHLDPKAKGR
jgi:membrane-bound lytic murein transglycosylase MltF